MSPDSTRRQIADWFEKRLVDLMVKYKIPDTDTDVASLLFLIMAYRGDLEIDFDTEQGQPIYRKPPTVN